MGDRGWEAPLRRGRWTRGLSKEKKSVGKGLGGQHSGPKGPAMGIGAARLEEGEGGEGSKGSLVRRPQALSPVSSSQAWRLLPGARPVPAGAATVPASKRTWPFSIWGPQAQGHRGGPGPTAEAAAGTLIPSLRWGQSPEGLGQVATGKPRTWVAPECASPCLLLAQGFGICVSGPQCPHL